MQSALALSLSAFQQRDSSKVWISRAVTSGSTQTDGTPPETLYDLSKIETNILFAYGNTPCSSNFYVNWNFSYKSQSYGLVWVHTKSQNMYLESETTELACWTNYSSSVG